MLGFDPVIMDRYAIVLFHSKSDGGFIADVPDLNAYSAFGRTPEIALSEVKRAMFAWFAAAKKERKPIPKAKYRPAIYQAAS